MGIGIDEIIGRVATNLEHLKQYTATPGDGCTRLPFTKEARDAVNYLTKVMEEAGMEVHEDAAGNVIGIMKGENPDAPCVMMGSHYDSVVNGGDFDGIAGVVCAIEVARQLKENGVAPKLGSYFAASRSGMGKYIRYIGSGMGLSCDVCKCGGRKQRIPRDSALDSSLHLVLECDYRICNVLVLRKREGN